MPDVKEKRLTLDTNILFYAMDRETGGRHKLAMEIIDSPMDYIFNDNQKKYYPSLLMDH